MRRLIFLFATTSALLCAPSTAQPATSNAQPPSGDCTDKQAVRIGDIVAVTLVSDQPGPPLSWSSSGDELRLATGQVQSVRILPAPPNGVGVIGSCLKANDYVRLQRAQGNTTQPAYLIAAPDVVHSNDVLIGNYPPTVGVAVFVIYNAGDPAQVYMHRGDHFRVRGTARDWWLLAPADAANGTKVALDQDPAKASVWEFPH